MIGLIQGQVHHLMAPTVVVMTPAGVGYEIEMPLNTFCQVQLNQSVTLWTHFLVREDAQ
jgi:Holliday junction DNA helicase RuvA